MMIDRRDFLAGLAVALIPTVSASSAAQEQPQGVSNAPMNQGAYKSVRRSPKPNATPQLTDVQRDELEHQLCCQCSCGHDIYRCRTTDFTCDVSPAMHRDVMSLVTGGYTAREIMDAFRETYGERVLMAPVKEGFNWVGYILPFAVLGAGGVLVSVLIKRWSRPAVAAATTSTTVASTDATPEELDRIKQAMRNDDQ